MRICKKIFVFALLSVLLLSLLLPKNILAATELPNIYSPSAILIDSATGKILYEKDINKKMYPASLTKMLTAIVVLDKCNAGELKLTDVATVSYDSVMSLDTSYLNANLQLGEELTLEQLLYVMIVASSNDSAIVIAEYVSGSSEAFSALMNQKAAEIGCTNSNFINPNGVHNENHYSTAYDLALIARYTMKNETFRKIVSTTSYQLPATNKYGKDDRVFASTNELIIVNNNDRADNYYYKYAIGIKTGFTTPAGNCLAAAAKRDNLEFISVVLGAGQTDQYLSQRYLDTKALFEYGFSNYTIREVAKKESAIQTLNVSKATQKTKKTDILLESDVSVLIKKDDLYTTLLPDIKLNDNIKAPLKKGEVVGSISYKVEGITYTYNLVSGQNVKESKFLLNFITILLLLFIIRIYLKNKKIRHKKNRRLKARKIK